MPAYHALFGNPYEFAKYLVEIVCIDEDNIVSIDTRLMHVYDSLCEEMFGN